MSCQHPRTIKANRTWHVRFGCAAPLDTSAINVNFLANELHVNILTNIYEYDYGLNRIDGGETLEAGNRFSKWANHLSCKQINVVKELGVSMAMTAMCYNTMHYLIHSCLHLCLWASWAFNLKVLLAGSMLVVFRRRKSLKHFSLSSFQVRLDEWSVRPSGLDEYWPEARIVNFDLRNDLSVRQE